MKQIPIQFRANAPQLAQMLAGLLQEASPDDIRHVLSFMLARRMKERYGIALLSREVETLLRHFEDLFGAKKKETDPD